MLIKFLIIFFPYKYTYIANTFTSYKSYKVNFLYNFNPLNNLNKYDKVIFKNKLWNFFFFKNLFFNANNQRYTVFSKNLLSKNYIIPMFFKKYFNISISISNAITNGLYLLYFYFIWENITQTLKFLFLYIPIKTHRYIYLFIKYLFTQKLHSKKLIYLCVVLKGKFSVYGDARKRKIKYSLGPYYNIYHPRYLMHITPACKTHYFFIRTTTGITSFIGLIKHIH